MLEVNVKAKASVVVLLPKGTRVWVAQLLTDQETGQPRFRIDLDAEKEDEGQAREALEGAASAIRTAVTLAAVGAAAGPPGGAT